MRTTAHNEGCKCTECALATLVQRNSAEVARLRLVFTEIKMKIEETLSAQRQ